MASIPELLTSASTFAGLRESQLDLIAGWGRLEAFAPDELIARESAAADRFYLLVRGAVALELVAPARPPLVIGTLHAGETLGWSWLFPPYRWQFDARAIEPVEAIRFDAVAVRERCDADHELGYQLMRRFAASLVDRLQSARFQLQDIYGHVGA